MYESLIELLCKWNDYFEDCSHELSNFLLPLISTNPHVPKNFFRNMIEWQVYSKTKSTWILHNPISQTHTFRNNYNFNVYYLNEKQSHSRFIIRNSFVRTEFSMNNVPSIGCEMRSSLVLYSPPNFSTSNSSQRNS